MFKKENQIWWYFLGVIVMMALLLASAQGFFLPLFKFERTIETEQKFVYTEPPTFTTDRSRDYVATFYTNKGILVANLYQNAAPKNVNNFKFLADEGFYNETLFHRIVPGFLIQGGDRNSLNDNFEDDGYGTPGYYVPDEINWDALDLNDARRQELRSLGYSSTAGLESHPLERYSLVMASDPSRPDTNGGQFFFVIADSNDQRLDDLNGYFTVIGKLTSGGDVLADMADTPLDDPDAIAPRPLEPLIVERIQVTIR